MSTNLVPTHIDKVTGELYATLDSITGGGGGYGSSNCVGYIHKQTDLSLTWEVVHAKNSKYFTFTLFDETGHVFYPDDVYAQDDNIILVKFTTPCTGTGVFTIVKEPR